MKNPLIDYVGIPNYAVIKPSHIAEAVERMLEKIDEEFAEIIKINNFDCVTFFKKLEEMEEPFTKVWGVIGHLLSVKDSEELRAEYQKKQPKIVAMGLKLGQSKEIYDFLLQIKNGSEWQRISNFYRRAVDLRLRSIVRSGIGLTGREKKRFNEIAEKLSELSTNYNNNILDSIKDFELIIEDKKDTAGWTSTLFAVSSQSFANAKKQASSPENGPWRITLDFPSYGAFMQHSRNQQQREIMMKAAITKAATPKFDNTEILREILKLRQEKAKLLGFKNYAEMSLDVKMAKEVSAVNKMREELFDACFLPAKREMEDLRDFALANGAESFEHWDISFWSERQREKLFDYSDEQLRPYFPLEKVLDGLFALSKKLFGIVIKNADGDAPIWHKDVSFYNVFNEKGDKISSFFLDPYSRPAEKNGGAWMNTLWNRSISVEKSQLPVVYLVCNGTPPTEKTPSLMSFYEVVTLFHEFGHGLQALLTTVDLEDLSGINGIDWDAVELASQFMENWCYDKSTLLGLTSHYQTGEKLPEALFEKVCAAKNFMSATAMLRQLNLGWIDMTLYDEYNPNGDISPLEVQQEIAEKCATILPPLQGNRLINSFSHIFCGGYSAGYYSYKWSEVLSADAFSAFEEAGLDNYEEMEKLGRKYKDTILALGGSEDPMTVFIKFRGRNPSTNALLRHSNLA